MITQVNDNNRHKYEALYAKAQNELRNSGDPNLATVEINSLETYFGKIEELLKSSKAGIENYGRTYTILPLDEEYFEIDTNTRIIKVPEAFRKNGIAVQGDMGAETIYFKVPRYFDAMDLDHTDIYIQWQYTNSQNKNVEQGISHEWVRDIESEDDYLIFGWTLGGRITEEAGTLQFSVRFINGKRDENKKITEISYSLSTLTATALINPGLNFGLGEVTVETLDDIISANYINTTTNTDSQIDIFQYVWDLDKMVINHNLDATVVEKDLDEEGKISIKLSAYVSPNNTSKGDELKYYLYKETGTQPSVNHDANTKIDMQIIPEKTKDGKYQEHGLRMYYKDQYSIKNFDENGTGYEPNKFYIKDEQGQYVLSTEDFNINTQYYLLTPLARYYPTDINNISLPDDVYEKYGVITLKGINDAEVDNKNVVYVPNIAGTYYGVTKVRINSNDSGPQYTNYKLSIPGPVTPEIDIENTKYIGYFEKFDETEGITYDKLPIVLKTYGEKDKIVCTWYKVISERVENNKTIREGELVGTVDNLDGFAPNATGKYYASILANRNCSDSPQVETKNYIVTKQAQQPEIVEQPIEGGSVSTAITFKVKDKNDISLANSEIECGLWKWDYNATPPVLNHIDNTTPDEIITNEQGERIYSFKFNVNTTGQYICKARSKYNDSESDYIESTLASR